MAHRFSEVTFTPNVESMQSDFGTYEQAQKVRERMPNFDTFRERERDFIEARDSFYMASTSEDGWPYIQHRGGEAGFLSVVDDHTLIFANYSGNGQFQSLGNLQGNEKVALFLMDYAHKRRLKILGRALVHKTDALPEQFMAFEDKQAESYIEITLEAFDWNCSQHITPRWTQYEINEAFIQQEENNNETL